jgi:eukaryotic-like serine/threonine-protein kinase
VYVQPFSGPGPRQQVSIDGGFEPAWARNGRQLFYQARRIERGNPSEMLQLIAVPVETGAKFIAGIPHMLFQRRALVTALGTRGYDVAADGRFLIVNQDRPPIKVTEMTVVQNWFEDLKRLVPVK